MRPLAPREYALLLDILAEEGSEPSIDGDDWGPDECALQDELADVGLLRLDNFENEDWTWQCPILTDRGRLALRVHTAYLASLS